MENRDRWFESKLASLVVFLSFVAGIFVYMNGMKTDIALNTQELHTLSSKIDDFIAKYDREDENIKSAIRFQSDQITTLQKQVLILNPKLGNLK